MFFRKKIKFKPLLKHKSEIREGFSDLAAIYVSRLQDMNMWQVCTTKSLNDCKNTKFIEEVADLYNEIGLAYAQDFGYYELGIKYLMKAVEIYDVSLENSNKSSYKNISFCYEQLGQEEKAEEWYIKANEGDIELPLKLARMYELKENNDDKALYWYEKAAEQGNVNAQEKTAYKYLRCQGADINPEKVLYWYKKACEGGSKEAQEVVRNGLFRQIATVFSLGIIREIDYEKAVIWFEKALEDKKEEDPMTWVEMDLINCYIEIGKLFYNGKTKERDYKEAIKWFTKSIDFELKQGYSGCIGKLMLGKCYYYGYGVNKNIDKAIQLIGQCASVWVPGFDFLQKIVNEGNAETIEIIKKYKFDEIIIKGRHIVVA